MKNLSLNEIIYNLRAYLENELSSLSEENLNNLLGEIYDAEGQDISGFDANRITLIKSTVKSILNNKAKHKNNKTVNDDSELSLEIESVVLHGLLLKSKNPIEHSNVIKVLKEKYSFFDLIPSSKISVSPFRFEGDEKSYLYVYPFYIREDEYWNKFLKWWRP